MLNTKTAMEISTISILTQSGQASEPAAVDKGSDAFSKEMDSAISADKADAKAAPDARDAGSNEEVKPAGNEDKGQKEDVQNVAMIFLPQYTQTVTASPDGNAGQTGTAPGALDALALKEGEGPAQEAAPAIGKPAENGTAVKDAGVNGVFALDDAIKDAIEVKDEKVIKKNTLPEKEILKTAPDRPMEIEPVTHEKGVEVVKTDVDVKTASGIAVAQTGAEGAPNNTGDEAKHRDSSRNYLKEVQGTVSTVQSRVEEVLPEKAPAKVSYPDIYEKLNNGVKMIVAREGGSVRMSLHPEHLGEMKITLSIEDKSVKAEVLVESNAVKEILSSDTNRLREIFSQNGLTLEQYSIGLNTPSEKDGYQGAGGRFGSGNDSFKENGRAAVEETAPYQKANNRTGIDIFI